MKKLFLALTSLLFATSAYATPVCGSYQSGCVDYPYGIAELNTLVPVETIGGGGIYYSGFPDSNLHALGMDEYVAFDGMGGLDGSYSAPPNALTVKAVQEFYSEYSAAIALKVPNTRTVNGHALSSNVTLAADDFTDGTTNKFLTASERTKLSGIATGATANSSDATLLNRANHTGTQSADTITDGSTNKAYTATEKTKLAGIPAGVTKNTVYEGTTIRADAFMVFKTATVSSGSAVFNITTDGTSGGTAICSNGIIKPSVNIFVSDSAATYQPAVTWSNSDKTVTVAMNKTAIALGLFTTQAAANGATVNLGVVCY